jgi:quercetin dioxygenase-like cupin family protein
VEYVYNLQKQFPMAVNNFKALLPELVERICQHLEKKGHQDLLRKLKDWTLDNKVKIFAKDISEFLYGSKDREQPARNEVRRLRIALEAYYDRAGATEKVRVGVEEQYYKLFDATPRNDPPRLARASDLGRIVRAFCELEEIDAAARAEKFHDWLSHKRALPLWAVADTQGFKDREFDQFLDYLRDHSIPIGVEDLDAIGDLFGISSLLLDPLLSEPVTGKSLTLDFEKDFSTIPRKKPRGKDAIYFTAHRRLQGTDAAFVRLQLFRNGESDNHEHPGDEMIWIESGEVELQFELSGVNITLRDHDLVHFYAEHRHKVIARKPAKCFIIRFYQIGAENTRQFLWRALEGFLSGADDAKYAALRNEAKAWIHEILPTYRKEGREINDLLGLERFLVQWADFDTESGVKQDRVDEKTRSKLEAALLGSAGHISLKDVAQEYGVEEFLLHSYRARAVPGLIVLRSRHDDFKRLPRQQTAGLFRSAEHRVEYYLPCRNLSCADMSLAKVILEPGGTTGPNRHPGHEAILMITGEATLFSDGDDSPAEIISSSGGQLCHFNSAKMHRIVNMGSGQAEFLVIRFHRDGSAEQT